MKKKYISLLLTITILLTCFCSCSKSNDTSSADTYLSMAQDFIDKNNHIAAMDILQKGFSETKDERIAVMIAELSTSNSESNPTDTAANITVDATVDTTAEIPSLKSCSGTWAEENIGWEYGGMIMDVECTDTAITIVLSYTQSAPMSRIAEITIEDELSNIKDGILAAELVEDGWGNKTTVQINLLEPDMIQCHIVEVVPGETALWGFYEGLYELYKNDTAHENMSYIMDEYYERYPEETTSAYDISKASGILKELGMSEQEFRLNCQPLKYGATEDRILGTRSLREYPVNYVGQLFYLAYFDIANRTCPNDEKVSDKDTSLDGYTTYYIYPDTQWKDTIVIFDCRDDVYSPTISRGDYIEPYMIFTGVQTINGTDYLCFNLISVDKQ